MKEVLKQIKDGCIYGYTGRLGNVIDFKSYRMDKAIKKYGNDPKICIVTFIITMAIGMYTIFH